MLTDDLNIRDGLGVSGLVVITDLKTGKVIVKKHNMITAWGKRIIYFNFIKNILKEDYIKEYQNSGYYTHSKDLSKYKLCKLALGRSEAETQYDMDDLRDKIDTSVAVFNNDMITITGYDSNSAPYIMLTCDFSNTGINDGAAEAVSELGLFLSQNENPGISTGDNGDKLFSRITFDPIPYLEDTSFKLEYYIYF